MRIVHHYFNPSMPEAAKAIAGRLGGEDIVVVAPAEALLEKFNELLDAQLNRKEDATEGLQQLKNEFLAASDDAQYRQEVEETFQKIVSLLYQGMIRTFADDSLHDFFRSFLVKLSAAAFASLAGRKCVVDGRNLVVCEQSNGIPVVDWRLTEENVKELAGRDALVVAGSYGRKIQGDTVVLGKRGSELTANILGNLLNASEVVFLTDGWKHDGAKSLTYEEAAQFFSSGKPVHPRALIPAKRGSVTVTVADVSDPLKPILTVTAEGAREKASGITGVVCSEPMTLFTVYGTGLLGSIGISSAILGALAKNGINIHFISQTTSEYSISFAVKKKVADRAAEALQSLITESYHGNYTDLTFSAKEVKIVSVFGYHMRNVHGISAKVYGALGNAGINVIAASQGGEELSISIVVAESDAAKATEQLAEICS